MKTYEIQLDNNGTKEKFHLRLNCGGQKKLKEKFEEDTMTIIMGAITDIEYAIELLETSLSYKDNDNSITDGEIFYDLLVDNGFAGQIDFAKVFTAIAVNSGIISKDQSNSIMKAVTNNINSVFDELAEETEPEGK